MRPNEPTPKAPKTDAPKPAPSSDPEPICGSCHQPYQARTHKLRRHACQRCQQILHPSPQCQRRHRCNNPNDPKTGAMAILAQAVHRAMSGQQAT